MTILVRQKHSRLESEILLMYTVQWDPIIKKNSFERINKLSL